MNSIAHSTFLAEKIEKVIFQLAKKTKNYILENEKEYSRERFIYNFKLKKATYKQDEPRECSNCKTIADKFCEKCITEPFQYLDIIDGFGQLYNIPMFVDFLHSIAMCLIVCIY